MDFECAQLKSHGFGWFAAGKITKKVWKGSSLQAVEDVKKSYLQN
jgi:hypothetical protein